MNTNNETNIIRGILNEAFIQTQPTSKSFAPPKAASAFTSVSSVPATTSASTSVPTPTTAGIQTKRPMSHEELMGMVKKSTKQAADWDNENFLNTFKANLEQSRTAKTPKERNSSFDTAMSDLDAHMARSDERQQKYKDWRAGRAAEGAEWAQRGEARDKVNAVRKENEKYLGDLKANLQQSRTAKTPEERKQAFNMAMTNVDTFVSKAEGRQQKIDAGRTPKTETQGKQLKGMDAPPPTEYFKKNPELWEKRKQTVAKFAAANTSEERQRHMDEVKRLDAGSEPLPSTGYKPYTKENPEFEGETSHYPK
jgi:hypothetical protein